jgi:DNA-binding Xre family transcriptional regulator
MEVPRFFIAKIRTMSNDEIDIGELILQKLKEDDRSVNWLAEKIYTDPSNLHKLLKKNSINTATLQKISKVLKCEFFISNAKVGLKKV